MSLLFGSERPSLDAHLYGVGCFTAPAASQTDNGVTADSNGVSVHYHEFPFDCQFNGIQFLASNVTLGDHVSFEVQYNAGAAGWKRYKRFGKEWFVSNDKLLDILLFPANATTSSRLVISYKNTGSSSAKFFINLFAFTDFENVNTSQLEEGTDW